MADAVGAVRIRALVRSLQSGRDAIIDPRQLARSFGRGGGSTPPADLSSRLPPQQPFLEAPRRHRGDRRPGHSGGPGHLRRRLPGGRTGHARTPDPAGQGGLACRLGGANRGGGRVARTVGSGEDSAISQGARDLRSPEVPRAAPNTPAGWCPRRPGWLPTPPGSNCPPSWWIFC